MHILAYLFSTQNLHYTVVKVNQNKTETGISLYYFDLVDVHVSNTECANMKPILFINFEKFAV